MNLPGLLGGWRVRSDGNHSSLVVDLLRAMTVPGQTPPTIESGAGVALAGARPVTVPPRLTVRLHATRPAVESGQASSFPDVVPTGATWREGGFAIELDEDFYEAQVSPPRAEAPPDEEGPWGRQTPRFYYPFKGEPVRGTLALRPRSARLRAVCTSDVFLASSLVALQLRLTLRAEVGTLDTVELVLSAPRRADGRRRTGP